MRRLRRIHIHTQLCIYDWHSHSWRRSLPLSLSKSWMYFIYSIGSFSFPLSFSLFAICSWSNNFPRKCKCFLSIVCRGPSAAAHSNGNVVALGSSRKWVSGLSIVCPCPCPSSPLLCTVWRDFAASFSLGTSQWACQPPTLFLLLIFNTRVLWSICQS